MYELFCLLSISANEEEDSGIDSKVRCVGAHPVERRFERRVLHPIKLAYDYISAG